MSDCPVENCGVTLKSDEARIGHLVEYHLAHAWEQLLRLRAEHQQCEVKYQQLAEIAQMDTETIRSLDEELAGLREAAEKAWGQITPEWMASRFHFHYEMLSPRYGYKTRSDSAVPWKQVPAKNKRLMRAVSSKVKYEIRTIHRSGVGPGETEGEAGKQASVVNPSRGEPAGNRGSSPSSKPGGQVKQ